MRVVYKGKVSERVSGPAPSDQDVLELWWTDWDDFGYKTTFAATCYIQGREVDLPGLRLLIANVFNTRLVLDELRTQGWDGAFPIPSTNYISVPADITFYEQLEAVLGLPEAAATAIVLRDASYLIYGKEEEAAASLAETSGFAKSLQRERASIKAYLDGWRIFERQVVKVLNLGFKYENIYGKPASLSLNFQSASLLPHDINVLIGPNGYGKSRILHQIVQSWIGSGSQAGSGFAEKPNLSQILVVSYSPFERFPVDLQGRKLRDKTVYRYFGFRGRARPSKGRKLGKISLSHDYPRRDAARSVLDCLSDDKRYKAIRGWANKLVTLERALRTAIDFDFIAVQVAPDRTENSFYLNSDFVEPLHFDIDSVELSGRFVPISSDRVDELDDSAIREALLPASGVTFFRNGHPLELSSGQRQFTYVVSSILGGMRRNSLVLIDEPELFLHPTLEVQLMEMLKIVLAAFNSKALLATHSVVTVREIPADCVHVLRKAENNILLAHPPFQTFGGDFQRIASYVFGDKAVSKPYESWIRVQLKELGSADELLRRLGDDLNEELIIQIKAMGRGKW